MTKFISLTIFIFVLFFSCNKNNNLSKNIIPHPDSIGVGTIEYISGKKQANNDFLNNTPNLFIIGLLRMDSLEIEMMKKEFEKKYKIKLHFEGCTGGSPFISGYNNKMQKLIENKYKIDLHKKIIKWTIN